LTARLSAIARPSGHGDDLAAGRRPSNVRQTTQFTAQLSISFGRAMNEVTITFASDNATSQRVDSALTNRGTGIGDGDVMRTIPAPRTSSKCTGWNATANSVSRR